MCKQTSAVADDTLQKHRLTQMAVQAEKQLPGGWTLMRGGTPGCPEPADWLVSNTEPHARIGIDPFLHTVRQASRTRKYCRGVDVSAKAAGPRQQLHLLQPCCLSWQQCQVTSGWGYQLDPTPPSACSIAVCATAV